jgi:hypothetical protein
MNATYSWHKLYDAAALETDFRNMQDCIARAEQAMRQRLSDSPPPSAAERQALSNSLGALAVLKAESASGMSRI